MTTPAKRIFSHDGFDSFSPCPALNILKEAVKKKDEYLMVRGRLTKREGTQKNWVGGGKHIRGGNILGRQELMKNNKELKRALA